MTAPQQSPFPPAGAFRPELDRRIGVFHRLGFQTLLQREMRRLWRMAAMVVVAPAVMAMIYFACFLFGLGPQRGTPEGDAVLTFLVPGLIMLSVVLRSAENTGFSLLFAKIEGMLVDQLMAPVGAREVVLAYALGGVVAGVVSGLAVWLGSLVLWPLPVAHPLPALGFATAGALMMALAGLLTGIASTKWDHMSAWFTFLFVPVSFLSGLFAPISGMPPAWQAVVQANPIFHAIDGFRWAMLGSSHQDPGLSALIVLGVCALLYALAARLYSIGWKMKA